MSNQAIVADFYNLIPAGVIYKFLSLLSEYCPQLPINQINR